MPTSNAIVAVRRIAVSVRFVMFSPKRCCAWIRFGRTTFLRSLRRIRQRSCTQRRTVRQRDLHDAADRGTVLDGFEYDRHLIADIERFPGPAALGHRRRILGFECPVADAPRVVHRIDFQKAMWVGPDPVSYTHLRA